MKKTKYFSVLIFAIFCSCVAPVNTTMERAKTLGAKHLEAAAVYSHYERENENNITVTNDNYGLRAGYGITADIDIKLRYERLVSLSGSSVSANYVSIFPKIRLWKNHLSVIIPLSTYFQEAMFDDVSRQSVAPELIGTYTFGKTSDITGTIKGDYFFSNSTNNDNFYVGFKIGVGVSSDLDKWAIRPEAGLLTDPGTEDKLWTFGIGFQYIFDFRWKK